MENIISSISHRGAELKRKYFNGSMKTFFSLYDGNTLPWLKGTAMFLTADPDFKGVTELQVDFA